MAGNKFENLSSIPQDELVVEKPRLTIEEVLKKFKETHPIPKLNPRNHAEVSAAATVAPREIRKPKHTVVFAFTSQKS